MLASWKNRFGVGRRSGWALAAAVLGYVMLATVSIAFFVQLQRTELQMRDFLATDDRSMFARTGLEYERAMQTLLRATGGPLPAQVETVRTPIDILYNRLTVFKAGSEATRFVEGLPEYNRLVIALGHALDLADAILARQTGPTVSRADGAALLSALDAVRPELEAAIAAVVSSSANRRDALQRDLDGVRALMFASLAAFAAGSILFIAFLAFNNRQMVRQNRKLERSEARLHAFIHNAPAFMAILDRQCRFETVNARAERFYEQPESALTGRRGRDVRDGAGEGELEALKLAVLETGMAQKGVIRHEIPNGEVWKFHAAFPIRDTSNAIEALGVVGLDITALKQAEAETVRQRVRAEEASAAKSRMLANASHELRTPLNAIIGFGQVIEAEMFGPIGQPSYKAYAADIVRSGEHLVGIINSVLDLSRMDSGQMELALGLVNPNALMATALTMVQPTAAQADVAVAVLTDDTLPDLLVDGGKLVQVLVNLLSNAIRFNSRGGRAALSCSASPVAGVAFVVTDTGTGIAESDLPQVVLPFVRGGAARLRPKDGNGLGLAIAKALVERHGGTLEIESVPGAGTKVTVRLPAERIAPFRQEARTA